MRNVVMTLGLLGASAGSALAQDVIATPPNAVFHFEQRLPLPDAGPVFDQAVGVMAVEPFDMGEPVANAPYSAEITTEVVQQLADGNRIERRTTSAVARDAIGRVRREQQIAAIGALLPHMTGPIVTIVDPVAQTHFVLDAGRKVATRGPLPFIKRLEGAGVARGRIPPPRTESLGASEREGVMVEGTRTTMTIEAGAIGNQAPIDVVSEQWYSPELKTIVFSRRSDPRFGETTYRLQNIVRADPPAELFQVPADFTVEAARGFEPGVSIQRKVLTAP